MSSNLDSLMTQVGTGKWSVFHFLALSYSNILVTPHTFGRPFLAPNLDYECISNLTTAATTTTTTTTATTTTTTTATTTIADVYNITEIDHCYQVDGFTPCSEWIFDTSTYYSTLTDEFALVCGREHLRTAYQSVYLAGVFLGTPISGFLADKYGRRFMVAISTCCYVVMALASAWLPDITSILVFRLVLGFLHGLVLLITYILVVEIAEPRRRTLLGLTIYMIWAASVVAWGGVAYMLRRWRVLQTVASLPGLLFLPSLWFLDESPRWLAVQGRHHDAYRVLRKAARWNGTTLPKEEEVLAILKGEATCSASSLREGSDRQTLNKRVKVLLQRMTILFRTPRLRRITLLMFVIYMLASMVYFGLSLSGGTLSDSPFVYMALSGLMEVPSYTLTVPVVGKFGRRKPGVFCFVFCGVTLLILAAVPKEHTGVIMALALLGKMTNSAAFMIFFYHSSELYPTEVRSWGLGCCGCFSRLGSILAPYILDFVGATRPWAASLVFGGGSVIAALCTCLLPETKGRSLPDTVAQSENPHHHHQHQELLPRPQHPQTAHE